MSRSGKLCSFPLRLCLGLGWGGDGERMHKLQGCCAGRHLAVLHRGQGSGRRPRPGWLPRGGARSRAPGGRGAQEQLERALGLGEFATPEVLVPCGAQCPSCSCHLRGAEQPSAPFCLLAGPLLFSGWRPGGSRAGGQPGRPRRSSNFVDPTSDVGRGESSCPHGDVSLKKEA